MSDPIDLQAERIKRLASRPFFMVPETIACPFRIVDLYRDQRALQRIGLLGPSVGVGITAKQARAFAALLLIAADVLDGREEIEEP